MRQYLLFISLLLLYLPEVLAQKGDYFVSHFTPEGEADVSSNFGLVQLPDGQLAIANRRGILIFDGKNWELYKSSGTPMSIVAGNDGIFSGGIYGVGFQPYGELNNFKKIHLDSIVNNVFQIEIIGDLLFAVEEKKIHAFSVDEKKLINSIPVSTGYIKKIISIGGKALIATSNGNFWINDEKLEYAEELSKLELIFAVENKNTTYAGTESGRLFEVEEHGWKEIKFSNDEYEDHVLQASFINAVNVDEKIAIQTLSSGLILFDPKTKKVDRIINQHNGLPDNEIGFISHDREGGIWLGHEYGLSRISPNLPLQAFNNFPGLNGNIICTAHFNGELYVGTSTGLYKLEVVKNYKEVINYVKNIHTKEDNLEIVEAPKSKGIFSFLKRKKQDHVVTKQEDKQESKTVVTYEKRVSQELKSIRYVYKKMGQIDAKVVQLVSSENELFAATLNGLFRIKGTNSIKLSSQPIKLTWINRDENLLIANTHMGKLISFKKVGKNWHEAPYFDGFQDFLFDIYEDDKNRIWFVSVNEIYFINYDKNDIYAGNEFEFRNPYMDPVYISKNKDGEVIFSNKYSQWKYNEATEALETITSAGSIKKFIKNSDELWVLINESWSTLSTEFNNKWLNSLKDITDLSLDNEKENIYVISDNKIYKIPYKGTETINAGEKNIILKAIKDNGDPLSLHNNLSFIQRQSNLYFEFIQPEYTGLIGVEYKYRVVGLQDEWTEWADDNNMINLSYLPEGQYHLELKSKNSLGEEASIAPVFFKVIPPYWKRPWFYAFEFCVLMMLLLLTIYLNRNKRRYRILNKLIAFLTLIIIIEFIQATAESNFETDISPIAGFFIQVIVALTVLPVEGFLRGLIIQDKKLKLPGFLKTTRK